MRLSVLSLPLVAACLALVTGSAFSAQNNGYGGGYDGGGRTEYIFAISWEPAFCEAMRNKPECRSLTPDRPDARQFSLHGLWKNHDDYCNVSESDRRSDSSGRWDPSTVGSLSPKLTERLKIAMPGVQSGLHAHEWLRHGTCSGLPAEGFFSRAIDLLDAVNGSEVKALFANHIGQSLTSDEIRSAFDKAFGPGAGRKVKIRCDNVGGRNLISQITISLSDQATGKSDLATAIREAGTTAPGCREGIVDAAGRN